MQTNPLSIHDSEKRLVNTSTAAKYLALSESLLNKMRLSGDGPEFVKISRSVRYTHEALDDFIASRRRRSTSDTGAEPKAA